MQSFRYVFWIINTNVFYLWRLPENMLMFVAILVAPRFARFDRVPLLLPFPRDLDEAHKIRDWHFYRACSEVRRSFALK